LRIVAAVARHFKVAVEFAHREIQCCRLVVAAGNSLTLLT
jgi:hypothetical protein